MTSKPPLGLSNTNLNPKCCSTSVVVLDVKTILQCINRCFKHELTVKIKKQLQERLSLASMADIVKYAIRHGLVEDMTSI